MVPQVICLHAHGVQGLAGERLWHGISLWQLHSHNSSARSKSSDVLCRWVHVGTICMPAEKSTYACEATIGMVAMQETKFIARCSR